MCTGDVVVRYFACTWTSMTSSAGGKTDRACRFDDYGGVDCAVSVPRYGLLLLSILPWPRPQVYA